MIRTGRNGMGMLEWRHKLGENMKKNWIPFIQMAFLSFSTIGFTLMLFMHSDTKTNNIIEAIRLDMKEFHGRMCAIEERNRKG